MTVTVGTTLHGHCNGYFGRDAWQPKIIIAMGVWDGVNWAVVAENGELLFGQSFSTAELEAWAVPE